MKHNHCVWIHHAARFFVVLIFVGLFRMFLEKLICLNTNSFILQVCDLPVRTAKFVARKNWVVTASDDMQVRVFNYNTLERTHAFEAHSDYIRCIAVHPAQPYILTSSGMLSYCYAISYLIRIYEQCYTLI